MLMVQTKPRSLHSKKLRILFMILTFSLLFTSCTDKSTDAGGDNTLNNEIIDTESGGGTEEAVITLDREYKIIFDGSSARSKAVAKELQRALHTKLGIIIPLAKDTAEPDSEKEILVGNTTRTGTNSNTDDIGSGGWKVFTDKKKCIIQGATSEALGEAADYFSNAIEVKADGTAHFNKIDSKTEYKTDSLAGADITLRVASFNIQNGSGVDHKMEELANIITSLELDVIGLQEVDVGTSRVGGLDTVKLLAEAAGYPYYEFSPAIDYRGGKYGHAIISKYPIVSYETLSLTTPEGFEKRVFGHAVLNIKGESIDFYNTHLSFEDTETRLTQFAELNKAIGDSRGFILTADFNTADTAERQMINGILVNNGNYVTFPSKGTGIDDIILHAGWDILRSGVYETLGKSDHNLLWAEIHFSG